MKNILGITIWLLLLILTLFLLLIIPDYYTNQIWLVLIFDLIAFITQLDIWFSKSSSSREVFYKYPTYLVSAFYLILQFFLSLIVANVNDGFSLKTVIIMNFVLFILAQILITATRITKGAIEDQDYRQESHHTRL